MELERLYDPRLHPFAVVDSVALGITGTAEQRHIGVIYKSGEEAASAAMLLELAWHHIVRSRPVANKYHWVQPRIHAIKARVLSRLCKLLADKYHGRRPSIAYALRYEGGMFDPASGEFLAANGRGLTCATFVLAIFASRGIQLLRVEEWPDREGDRAWQRRIVEALRQDAAEETHVAAVEQEIGCARFRPEEVAAAGTSPRLPASFDYASRVGEAIVDRLCRHADA